MANRLLSLSLLTSLTLVPIAAAQTDWRFHLTTNRPQARCGHGLAFDTQRNKLVLFGGFSPARTFGDLWEFDGVDWTQRVVSGGPSPRSFAAMTYMERIGRVLLFGGQDSSGRALNDTWLFNGTAWQQIPTQFGDPEARVDAAITYSPTTHDALLFGGGANTALFPGLWAFNGIAWRQLGGPVEPPVRSRASLAFDISRNRAVLFGGARGFTLLNDTWEWTGSDWQQRSPDERPTPRAGHGSTYDPFRRRVVVFGGTTSSGLSNETYEYEGSTYFRSPSPITIRFLSPMAFDFNLRRAVLIGGQTNGAVVINDTNSYGAVNPATFAPFGIGCTGSAGVPTLAAAQFSVPYLFTTFRTELRQIPANAPAVMILGGSNTNFRGTPLPLPLGVIGMPNCSLLVSLDLTLPMTTSGAVATSALDIPFLPALIGQAFFQQGLVVDPPANATGLTVSNGGTALVGKLD